MVYPLINITHWKYKMKKYAYIVMYMGKAVGAGTLAADRGSLVTSRLGKMYGRKSQGFSWILIEML